MAQKADSEVFKCLTLGPQLKDIQLTVIEEYASGKNTQSGAHNTRVQQMIIFIRLFVNPLS